MELYNKTIHELRDLIKARKISVVELTDSIIKRLNETEPILNCYISVVAEKAGKKALEIQNMIDSGQETTDLTGIPLCLKDNICTKDITATCGSKMLENFIPPYNATVVERLLGENAIIVGKSNMDEFAMGSTTENSYFKETKNPWDIKRVPGGSSGGSAAAVSAGSAVFSLGSDTGGSLRQPAAFCGVVGLKPTYGTVSRFGLIPHASSFDQIGPITKDVTDAAIVLNTIAGNDMKDSTSADIIYKDFTQYLVNDVSKLRIGIPRNFLDNRMLDRDTKTAIEKAIQTLELLGAECEEFNVPLIDYIVPIYYLIALAEASSNLARYDGIKYGYRTTEYSNIEELYTKTRSEGFGTEVKRRIMLGTYVLSQGYKDKYYKKAIKIRNVFIGEMKKVMKRFNLILGPTTYTTAYEFGQFIDAPLKMYLNDISTAIANISGLPAISIPCGLDKNRLPIGLQLIGDYFSEGMILRAAYTFEQNNDFPCFAPDINIS